MQTLHYKYIRDININCQCWGKKEKIFLRVENNSLALRVPAPACLPSPPGRWDQSKVVKWTKLEIVP